MSDLPGPRTPILVGVGVADHDAEAAELMATALGRALADTGAGAVAGAVDRIAVPQGTWSYPDPGRLVAAAIGAGHARTHLVELGIPQQTLFNGAMAAVLEGSSEVAVVVGGESVRWARDRERAGLEPAWTPQVGAVPDVHHRRDGPLLEPVEVAHRFWEPVQQYAMIENALRAADGHTPGQQRSEVSALWARFNRVATVSPGAAFPAPRDAAFLATPSTENRPLSFPYNKWHSSQSTVNRAAAMVLCSVEAARRLAIPTDRWIFPLVGIESNHAVSLLRRSEPATWPALSVLAEAAAGRLGRPVAEAEVVELYSCFPSAVRVQQRTLGLDPEGTPTVTGGMAFSGGPFNNSVLQGLAAVVPLLREDPGVLGLVTTVSGLLTKPGLGVWSARPDGRPPLLADLARESAAATGVVEAVGTLDGYGGPGTVVTYTVTYEGLDPVRTIAVCDTADGRRCMAASDDPALAARACVEELIGTAVEMGSGSFVPG